MKCGLLMTNQTKLDRRSKEMNNLPRGQIKAMPRRHQNYSLPLPIQPSTVEHRTWLKSGNISGLKRKKQRATRKNQRKKRTSSRNGQRDGKTTEKHMDDRNVIKIIKIILGNTKHKKYLTRIPFENHLRPMRVLQHIWRELLCMYNSFLSIRNTRFISKMWL